MGNCKQYMEIDLIMEATIKTLKDWGIDWILQERGTDFKALTGELKLAINKVI